MQKFQRCITDAKTLSQLEQEFQKNTKERYVLINNAKYYASVADSSSINVPPPFSTINLMKSVTTYHCY